LSITKADVAEILKLLQESSFDELSLETGDVKIQLRRSGAQPRTNAPAAPTRSAPSAPESSKPTVAALVEKAEPGVVGVPSPMLGAFYRAPKPGEPPFVEVGQRVAEDTIIGIIEVMKLMNTVRAGVSGEVVDIPALVEYGETLIRVRTD
jgi:acetyl-CoA carboxylase biotin carboxyl carrier protein